MLQPCRGATGEPADATRCPGTKGPALRGCAARRFHLPTVARWPVSGSLLGQATLCGGGRRCVVCLRFAADRCASGNSPLISIRRA
jgi:hypothetical protein